MGVLALSDLALVLFLAAVVAAPSLLTMVLGARLARKRRTRAQVRRRVEQAATLEGGGSHLSGPS